MTEFIVTISFLIGLASLGVVGAVYIRSAHIPVYAKFVVSLMILAVFVMLTIGLLDSTIDLFRGVAQSG